MVEQDPDIERKLSGRTLQVYLYLQRKKVPGGIREIQRDLGLSSPSVADYQVEKLVGLKLAAKDRYGRVSLTRKVKVKALESYVNFGRFSVPRLAFYASVFSAVALLYTAFSHSDLSVYGVAVPAAAAAVLWLEAWRMWKFSLLERAEKAESKGAPGVLPLLVPGMVALAVLLAGGAFLFQYVQEPSQIQVETLPPMSSGQQTIEESVSVSEQKVAAAGNEGVISPELAAAALPLAGAAVIGFLGYILVRYRSGEEPVLIPERLQGRLSGTQDYPERLR